MSLDPLDCLSATRLQVVWPCRPVPLQLGLSLGLLVQWCDQQPDSWPLGVPLSSCGCFQDHHPAFRPGPLATGLPLCQPHGPFASFTLCPSNSVLNYLQACWSASLSLCLPLLTISETTVCPSSHLSAPYSWACFLAFLLASLPLPPQIGPGATSRPLFSYSVPCPIPLPHL